MVYHEVFRIGVKVPRVKVPTPHFYDLFTLPSFSLHCLQVRCNQPHYKTSSF